MKLHSHIAAILTKASFAACAALFVANVATAQSAQTDIAKYDSNMAIAEVVTNGLKWIDGRTLPLEGRAFDDKRNVRPRHKSNDDELECIRISLFVRALSRREICESRFQGQGTQA